MVLPGSILSEYHPTLSRVVTEYITLIIVFSLVIINSTTTPFVLVTASRGHNRVINRGVHFKKSVVVAA
jgi:hypothetical protein